MLHNAYAWISYEWCRMSNVKWMLPRDLQWVPIETETGMCQKFWVKLLNELPPCALICLRVIIVTSFHKIDGSSSIHLERVCFNQFSFVNVPWIMENDAANHYNQIKFAWFSRILSETIISAENYSMHILCGVWTVKVNWTHNHWNSDDLICIIQDKTFSWFK